MLPSAFRWKTLHSNKSPTSFPEEHPAPRGFFVSNRLAYLLKNNWKI